jgi:hypothetical protein
MTQYAGDQFALLIRHAMGSALCLQLAQKHKPCSKQENCFVIYPHKPHYQTPR